MRKQLCDTFAYDHKKIDLSEMIATVKIFLKM